MRDITGNAGSYNFKDNAEHAMLIASFVISKIKYRISHGFGTKTKPSTADLYSIELSVKIQVA